MYTINPFSLNQLNNAEFVGFFVNVKQMIDKAGAEELGLPEATMQQYEQLMQALNDQVRASRGSAWTAELVAANDRRCQVFKRINLRLQMVSVAEKNSGLLAAKPVAETLLKLYPMSVTRLPYAELTTVVQGFIYDMNTQLTEDDIDNLGIGSDISTLEVANNEFITAYNLRAEERAAEGNAVTATLRGQMLEHWGYMAFGLQYRANDTKTEAKAKQQAAVCQQFIAVLNEVIADVKYRYQQRRKKADNPDDEGQDSDIHGGGTDGNTSGNGGGTGSNGGGTNTGGGGGTNTGGGGTGNTGGNTPGSDDNHVEF